MLRDTEHFRIKIGSLDGAGDAGDYLVNLVKAKNVPKAKAPTPPPLPEKEVTANGKTSNDTPSHSKADAVRDLEKAQTSGETKA